MQLIKLTKKERELVAKEYAKRIIDMAYMVAEDLARERIPSLLKDLNAASTDSDFTFTLGVAMCKGDILQIIGRVRREKAGKRNG